MIFVLGKYEFEQKLYFKKFFIFKNLKMFVIIMENNYVYDIYS